MQLPNHKLFSGIIGFDELMRQVERRTVPSFPPYNIERVDEENYRLTLALAGFSRDDITVQTANGSLDIEGKSSEEDGKREFIHKGIANRNFKISFRISEVLKVEAAEFANGILSVSLRREVPEHLKPRTVDIV